ncbi:vesicular glutamate transporter 2-like [Macrosteles quadrilineatus]|uniref:vesicular glutamate transporter 2-like n=1 Tax=Macrosteles quadrilineatus TaxID=74068 RepID=UPI0023E1F64E|nr:vesicular glutamate transporter 2-like [Macrosteles quadrilineatus]
MAVLARTVLWYIVFAGFAVNYMVRININIAMVSMVSWMYLKNQTKTSQCIDPDINGTSVFKLEEDRGFPWDETIQNKILGAFFWFHWVTQIPGGVLARKYGTKAIFGLSNFSCCLLNLLIPACAYWDYKLLVANRVIQGLIVGMAWPSMHHLTAQWIPPNERSKFVSAYLGSSVGVAITYPLCGFILNHLTWDYVFYVTGVLGTVWFIMWWLLVYDSPSQHPWITSEELKYIQDSLGQTLAKKKTRIPWGSIATSVPVYMVIVAQWGGGWGLFTLMTQAPTYFSVILGLDIKMAGIWSGIPHLCRWLFALGFGIFADHLLKKQALSRTNVRKLAVFFSNILQGLLVIGLAYSGCNSQLAILFLILATGVHGAVTSGPLSNVVDISPNFASVLQGVVGLVTNTPGFVSAYLVGELTFNNQTLERWKLVFLITSGMLISSGIVYVLFASSELQSWNSEASEAEEKEALSQRERISIVKINSDHSSNENSGRNGTKR